MKENTSKAKLKRSTKILGNIVFQHLIFLIPLAIMTGGLYFSVNFGGNWKRIILQVIILLMIPIFSCGLSKVTIKVTDNYEGTICKGIVYFLTILFLGIIYMFTSLFILLYIVGLMEIQLELSWLIIVLIIVLITYSLVFALVHIRSLIREYYKGIENKKAIEQALMFIFIFCYGIPALLLTLVNAQSTEVIPGHYIIFINVFFAGFLSINLQGYKNAHNNTKGTVIFANYLQDIFALLIVFAALDLKIEKFISFHLWLILFTLIFAGIRSCRELKK